ncbi:predicted protein [Naegleria gruberi]|uniref:Mannosyltransferase n=1 Tax=Naegleria gruberi TaxID=5762 RepID=D2VNW5_NAEGR|nr:uncharacterized protein NAEGRDRAFT_70642 [Naegleria gruberi]EFC41562.1 predicted protein [Naegleria gruberi]|eukprot:XP_002674306.1 predicted protein [Naegleria gruberi strain NEG-M]
MYGQFTIVILNFLKFNIVENLAHLYGTQPWHWYFTQGFPVMLLTHFPLYVWINFVNREYSRKYWKLNCVILLPVLVYSLQAHKEFRFIYPILPLCFISIGDFIHNKVHITDRGYRLLLVIMTIVQLGAVFYLGRIHQSAPIKVVNHLRSESQQFFKQQLPVTGQEKDMVVHLLMPCHHLPGHAFLFEGRQSTRHIKLFHLDCSPFDGDDSQADRFYNNPLEFVQKVSKTHKEAHYVVMYDHHSVQSVAEFLIQQHNFTLHQRFFHMHLTHDSRIGRQIIILKKN